MRYNILLIVSTLFILPCFGQNDKKNKLRVKLVMNTKDTIDCFANLSVSGENGTAFSYERVKKNNNDEIDFPLMNTNWVNEAIINGESYLMRRVYKEGYSIFAEGCLLKKDYGIDSFALYKWGDTLTGQTVISLPEKIGYEEKFVLIDNRHFRTASTWGLVIFKKCPELKALVRNKEEGWTLSETMALNDRIIIWKKYIDKYKSCIGQ